MWDPPSVILIQYSTNLCIAFYCIRDWYKAGGGGGNTGIGRKKIFLRRLVLWDLTFI